MFCDKKKNDSSLEKYLQKYPPLGGGGKGVKNEKVFC